MVKICDGGAPSTWRNAGYVDRNQKALINTGYCDTNIYRKYEQEKEMVNYLVLNSYHPEIGMKTIINMPR